MKQIIVTLELLDDESEDEVKQQIEDYAKDFIGEDVAKVVKIETVE